MRSFRPFWPLTLSRPPRNEARPSRPIARACQTGCLPFSLCAGHARFRLIDSFISFHNRNAVNEYSFIFIHVQSQLLSRDQSSTAQLVAANSCSNYEWITFAVSAHQEYKSPTRRAPALQGSPSLLLLPSLEPFTCNFQSLNHVNGIKQLNRRQDLSAGVDNQQRQRRHRDGVQGQTCPVADHPNRRLVVSRESSTSSTATSSSSSSN